MRLTVRYHDIISSIPTVLLHETDCHELGVEDGDRVRVKGRDEQTFLVTMSDTLVDVGDIMVNDAVLNEICVSDGECVDVNVDPAPASVRSIRRKMDGLKLDDGEIHAIVDDTMEGRLSAVEVSAWLTSLHIHGMDMDEIASYTRAMSVSGGRLDFGDRFILDFHSFGGIAGNKITPIVVSIVAAAGHSIPKLSSRAISSACGTADFVETFCDIDQDDDDILRITNELGGTFSWTGSTDLGPAGDVFIKSQRPLGIDPRPQLLASIMGKKLAAGAKAMLMDIPTGPETKVKTREEAESYTRDLEELGRRIGIEVECAITPALEPLGVAVGPVLEARECMRVLERESGSEDVADKACLCAGILLRMAGDPDGQTTARHILDSGMAHAKFLEIATAQGGDSDIRSTDMIPGLLSAEVRAESSGMVRSISNKAVIVVAKSAGAPGHSGSGLILHRKCGMAVSEGDVLMTIYADRVDKLDDAVERVKDRNPFTIG